MPTSSVCSPTRAVKRSSLLTLIRHGATAWNASRRFQGRTDVALSEEGRAQARALAARLATERLDAIYASDLIRARETAGIVAAPHGLTVRPDARLREFDFGAWEGLTWAEIVATRPHLRDAPPTGAALYAPDGGETFDEVRSRIAAFFEALFAGTARAANVAIVAHAGPLHAALAALGLPPTNEHGEAAMFSAASITRIAMEGGRPRLITLSDVRHLHPAG
jgi:broad specificity phosphatase PhoE